MHRILIIGCLIWGALPAIADPALWGREWPQTDFEKSTVEEWGEIISGGPPKDGIPALVNPAFTPIDQADLPENEPVITVELPQQPPRAYPLRYLIWHEIVNDQIGTQPVAVTFCPLCNSGLTFDRRLDGRVLEFGVSGKLRGSDMVMYDRQTESWWQQTLGRAIVGELTGAQLAPVASWMESVGQFRARNPDGLIMDQPDFPRAYGRNPYVGYDGSTHPFLYSGALPPHDIPALARVVRVGPRAWPLSRLRETGELSEAGVRLTWQAGQSSALDTAQIAKGRDVGSIRVRDAAGRDLTHDVMFAFAFHAFWPEGEWMLGR